MIARTWLRMNDWADNVLMCKWDPVWSPAWWGARIVVVVDLLLWQPSRWARVQPARVKRSWKPNIQRHCSSADHSIIR